MVRPLNTLNLPGIGVALESASNSVDCELKERRHDSARETRNSVWLHGLCDELLPCCAEPHVKTPQNAPCDGPEGHHSVQHMLPNNPRPTMRVGGADDCAAVDQVHEKSEWTTSSVNNPSKIEVRATS